MWLPRRHYRLVLITVTLEEVMPYNETTYRVSRHFRVGRIFKRSTYSVHISDNNEKYQSFAVKDTLRSLISPPSHCGVTFGNMLPNLLKSMRRCKIRYSVVVFSSSLPRPGATNGCTTSRLAYLYGMWRSCEAKKWDWMPW